MYFYALLLSTSISFFNFLLRISSITGECKLKRKILTGSLYSNSTKNFSISIIITFILLPYISETKDINYQLLQKVTLGDASNVISLGTLSNLFFWKMTFHLWIATLGRIKKKSFWMGSSVCESKRRIYIFLFS